MYALRMALRQFRLHPAFALITILVLGLGTGAATLVYTIVDSVVLRPLPYRAPDELVKLWDTNLEKGLTHDPISPVTFMDYRALPVFADAAGWWRPEVNLVDPGMDPVRVKTIETSANLFTVLGVEPQAGPGLPEGRRAVRSQPDRRDQRPALAHPLQRRPGTHRQTDPAERNAVHGGRRDETRVQLPGRRGCVAAAAVGLHAAQPQRALRGSRREARARHVARAGARGHGVAGDQARHRIPAKQQRMGVRRGAAARRHARLLPAGAVGAVRRRRAAVRDRLPERRVAAAHARARPRAGSHCPCCTWRRAAPAGHAAPGGELSAVTGRRRGGLVRRLHRTAAHQRHVARGSAASCRSGHQRPRPGAGARPHRAP